MEILEFNFTKLFPPLTDVRLVYVVVSLKVEPEVEHLQKNDAMYIAQNRQVI